MTKMSLSMKQDLWQRSDRWLPKGKVWREGMEWELGLADVMVVVELLSRVRHLQPHETDIEIIWSILPVFNI